MFQGVAGTSAVRVKQSPTHEASIREGADANHPNPPKKKEGAPNPLLNNF